MLLGDIFVQPGSDQALLLGGHGRMSDQAQAVAVLMLKVKGVCLSVVLVLEKHGGKPVSGVGLDLEEAVHGQLIEVGPALRGGHGGR